MSFGSLPSVLGNGGGVAISVIGGTGLFADGTAAAPSISFAADSDTGFYRHSANIIGVAAGGNASLRFGYGGGGYIQGGGSNATILFASAGGIEVAAAGTNQNITLTPSGTGLLQFNGGSGGQNVAFNKSSGNNFYFSVVSSVDESLRFQNSSGTNLVHFDKNGRVLIGTTTDSNNGILQLATHTTSAGGIGFGTDTSFFRNAQGRLTVGRNDGTNAAYLRFAYNTSTSAVESGSIGAQNTVLYIDSLESGGSTQLRTNGSTTALTLDSSQRTILSGALRLNNAYVAGAVVGTGYVTIQDSTGTTYRVPVLV